MPTGQGWNNQKKLGKAQFETVHALGSDAFGQMVAAKALYELTAEATLGTVSDVLGPNGQVALWNVLFTSHGAQVGDVLRMSSGTPVNWEYEIVEVIDVNNFLILPITSSKPSGDGEILRWITQKVDSSGNPQVSVVITDPSQLEGVSGDIQGLGSTTPVTLVADIGVNPLRQLEFFAPTGVILQLLVNDVDDMIIKPGGTSGPVWFNAPANASLKIKTVSGTINNSDPAECIYVLNLWT